MSALRFDDVTIRLGGRDILSAASFVVEDGEFIGMLGANGAGKTTLMRAALGLTRLASGAIRVLDQPVTRGNSSIGYMPQNRALALGLRLTGYDIVASAAIGARFGFAWLDKATRREIDWALDHVDARDLARRSIGELSGGERQRLLLSQALLGRPRLLLLDEPAAGMGDQETYAVTKLIRDLHRAGEMAIVLIEHDMRVVFGLADRITVLDQGGLLAEGSPAEIAANAAVQQAYLGKAA